MSERRPLAENFQSVTAASWRALVDQALKTVSFEKALQSESYDGIKIDPLYVRGDNLEGEKNAPPGQAPFTRGGRDKVAQPAWDIVERHTASSPEDANKAVLEGLEGGANSLLLQIEAPGQIGIKLSDASDLSRILDNVYLDYVPISLSAGSRVFEIAPKLTALWKEKGGPLEKLRGAFSADPIGHLVRHGSLPINLDMAYEKLARLADETADHFPCVTTLLADGRPFHDAGASEAQEIACMAAVLVAYIRALEAAGMPVDRAFSQMSFALSVDSDLFFTIAKLRVARQMISRIAETSGVGLCADQTDIMAQSAERMVAKRDPYVNILRGTMACAGAAIGGAGSLLILPYQWALGEPDSLSRRVARNTQIVLQEESLLGHILDPAGGSWYVEQLTTALADKSWALFQKIEAFGGMVKGLQGGLVQSLINETFNQRRQNIANAKEELTGVSAFPHLAEKNLDISPHPQAPSIEQEALTVEPLPLRRLAEPFETLREASDYYCALNEDRPKIFLANLGSVADFNMRATYAINFFAAGGIEAISNEGFHGAEEAAEAFRKSGAHMVCLCSTDVLYDAHAIPTAQALKKASASHIYMAGRARERQQELKAAGIHEFIYKGCQMLDILEEVHQLMGLSSPNA